MKEKEKKEFTYEIVKHIGVLSENKSGWQRQLNIISWNGGAPKYDIRDWSPDREKMGKGITFTDDEMKALMTLLRVRKETDEEVFRRVEHEYLLEGAKTHVMEYLGSISPDEDDIPTGVNADLELLVERYEKRRDCNAAEHDTWKSVVEKYFSGRVLFMARFSAS